MMSKKKGATRTQVTTTVLSPLEEKVVRIRHGLRAPDGLVLEAVGQDDPEVAAKLAEIEARALATVGATFQNGRPRRSQRHV